MKAVVVGLALALMGLAGCVSSDEDPGAPADPDIAAADGKRGSPGRPGADAGPVDAPLWSVGDWWQYQVDYASGESYSAKMVVYAEDSTTYHVTSDDRDLILRAGFTHYPTIGAVKKSDLSQTIHGQNVQYLGFPMDNRTWTGTFRDFPAEWRSEAATLPNGDGWITTVRNTDDGLLRIASGYSPAVKWFTNFTFDFDGVAPADVTYTLQDWGTNHTGTLPVVEIIDNAHRPFPTLSIAPPDPASPPPAPDPQQALDTVLIGEGSSLLWGYFGAAGGAGLFRIQIGHESSGAYHTFEWQPSAGGGTFEWQEISDLDAGEWGLSATGFAQFFSFLFVEAYEVKTSEVTL